MHSPLSGSPKCTLLKSVDVNQLSQRWLAELGISWLVPLGVERLQYWRDDSTGLHFFSPREAAGDATLYSQLQHLSWYYMDQKWEFDVALAILKMLPVGSRLLEIGVGKGAFLSKAREAGLLITGMELNPVGAETAREKGFTILQQDMSSLLAEDSTTWDALCAFQVLEHLSDPRLFFDQAISLLKPGGLLVLSVPNAVVARKLDPDCTDLLDQPPHHMTHWDESVFRSLETFLPLKLRHVAFEPLAPYHINWFIGSWSQRLKKKVGKWPAKMILNRLTVPALGNSLRFGLRRLVLGHTLLVCFEKTE